MLTRGKAGRSGVGLTFVFSISLLGLAACGEGDESSREEPQDPEKVVLVPRTREGVQQSYDLLGNDCSGFVQRTFTPHAYQPDGDIRMLHSPLLDPGRMVAWKDKTEGWPSLLTYLDMATHGIAQEMNASSPERADQCSAVRQFFTSTSEVLPENKVRTEHLAVVLYADEHSRPESLPADGSLPPSVEVPVRLDGYLQRWTSTRTEVPNFGYNENLSFDPFRIQLSCSKPLVVTYRWQPISRDSTYVDPQLCRPNPHDSNSQLCLAEVIEHTPGNQCRFVALSVEGKADSEQSVRFALGGTLTADDEVPPNYKLHVERILFRGSGD